jgi:predicted DNA-binding WGR domain protein
MAESKRMTMKGGPNFTEMREKALDESIKKDTTTHFLGEGTEKFVWWTGKEPLVVINSKSRQGRHTDGKKKQRVEYYFTQKLKKEKGIGEHIPNVYEIDSSYRFSKDKGENEQFRYLKEKTTPFSDVNSCLNAMMKLNRICIRHGFSYIDFKPANVGRINSEAFLIDTDPAFFFKIPEELKALFEIENQMTALLSIYNYGRCSHETKKALKEFEKDNNELDKKHGLIRNEIDKKIEEEEAQKRLNDLLLTREQDKIEFTSDNLFEGQQFNLSKFNSFLISSDIRE